MASIFEQIPVIDFDQDKHLYTIEGNPLTSVSRFLDQFEEPFDADKISFFVARKQVREAMGWSQGEPDDDEEIQRVKALVLAEWDAKRDGSIDHGNRAHKIMEDAISTGIAPLEDRMGAVQDLLDEQKKIYKEVATEQMIFNKDAMVAGTCDLALVRATKNLIIDIEDFKTNLHKGIVFDSISRKDNKIKHYSKFFLSPLDHLEDCNYNRYALQLSLYAYMFEMMLGARIGRIGIRWVEMSEDGDIISLPYIPIPYLRSDVIRIMIEQKQSKPQLIDVNDDF